MGRPVQVYVSGRTVDALEPLVTMKPVELVTVRFTGPLVAPCATDNVPPVRLEVSEKLSVVAVTTRLTGVEFEAAPDVPMTVTVVVAAAVFGCV